MIFDTIVGKATANGVSALNIIRVSGEDAIELVNKIFVGKNLLEESGNSVVYGHLIDKEDLVDEVMVSLFKKPKSFTKENMAEISCHGGNFIANEILKLLIKNGARMAERGEFTKRAFLNGRIDLAEAESIMDIINAKTKAQLQIAGNALNGDLSKLIHSLQDEILEIVAQIEVNIDYPEYDDVVIMTDEIIIPKIILLIDKIKIILEKANTGKIIRDGIKTVIIGKPNVGKSSLLNSLLKEEKAIVTEISGTTRDLIEAELDLNGILLKLIDTAGIRETSDFVEKIGVEKAKNAILDAELILLVLDQSQSLTDLDMNLLDLTKDKTRILVGNKIDLGKKIDLESEKVLNISAKNNFGLEDLAKEVKSLFINEAILENHETVLSNVRHIAKLQETLLSMEDSLFASKNRMPIDMVEIDLKHAWATLGEITGDNSSDHLISLLFSKFCLGK
ncbi:MAG: tRNA uridine-5-carboxymethylaminomethyl(34) synthesis GTPase MnmE [Firmicutes bacterium]|nr:tRNA uridine-5-carboxymethylaminomethyl(34) synthesis GTPase MnmE [Bacillota bacterium]